MSGKNRVVSKKTITQNKREKNQNKQNIELKFKKEGKTKKQQRNTSNIKSEDLENETVRGNISFLVTGIIWKPQEFNDRLL